MRTQFTDASSVLGSFYARAAKHFLYGIDPQIHADAYVGGLPAGIETHAFSVWNQAFTLYVLLE